MNRHLHALPFTPDPTLPRTIAPTPGEMAAVVKFEMADLIDLGGTAMLGELGSWLLRSRHSAVALEGIRDLAEEIGA